MYNQNSSPQILKTSGGTHVALTQFMEAQMKNQKRYAFVALFSIFFIGCGDPQSIANFNSESLGTPELGQHQVVFEETKAKPNPSGGGARQRGTSPNQTPAITGAICSWDYGAGIGGIYTNINEFKAFVQNKVNSGVITHCVSVSGQRLNLNAPNGLFGPCMGAVAQNLASYELWASCVRNIQ